MTTPLEDKIRVKQLEINVEREPLKRQELQKQLRKLQLELEIQTIRKRIEQLG